MKVRFIDESDLVNKDCPSWGKFIKIHHKEQLTFMEKSALRTVNTITFHEQLGISLFFVCPAYVNLRIPLTPHKCLSPTVVRLLGKALPLTCLIVEIICSSVPLNGASLGGFTQPDIFRAESITGCSLYTL